MDACDYKIVSENLSVEEKFSVKSILRQLLINSSIWTPMFLAGLSVGAPTVFIPQLKKEANSTVVIDNELISWLYATSGFAMYPWIVILPFLSDRFGRKLPQLLTAICSIVMFAILYLSRNPYHILIAEVFQGYLYAGSISVRIQVVTEYSSPKYRGIFLAIKVASFYWGIWVSNAIGSFFYWKNIAILGFFCSIYIFNVVFWPESPLWLASKGRFEECQTSYRWLHGNNEVSETKLNDLITFYSQRKQDNIGFFKMVKSKQFYKPMLICIITIIQYNCTGKLVCSLYILDIFKNVTKDEKTAYMGMLILDGVTVLGMYIGSYLSKILKRRTLYLSTSFIAIFILFLFSMYLYLVRYNILKENDYATIAFLMIYSFSISCGPMILSMSIYGEIIPTKYQVACYVVTGIVFSVTYSWLIKLTPFFFANFGIHGTFLFFCITCGLCTVYLYVYMPETNNKTHQEIDLFFSDDVNNEKHERLK